MMNGRARQRLSKTKAGTGAALVGTLSNDDLLSGGLGLFPADDERAHFQNRLGHHRRQSSF